MLKFTDGLLHRVDDVTNLLRFRIRSDRKTEAGARESFGVVFSNCATPTIPPFEMGRLGIQAGGLNLIPVRVDPPLCV